MTKIESINIWQRSNDSRFTVCLTVRAGKDIKYEDHSTETPTRRIRFTSNLSGDAGLLQCLSFIELKRTQYLAYSGAYSEEN